jgi:2-dehydro-3-deoxy-D-arabinonate dehydratase
LYLPQSKVYQGSCSLGPVLVPVEDLPDPYNLDMTCTITRAGNTVFSGAISTAKLHRKVETLIEYLIRANPAPLGTVLLTGTGIIVPEDAALQPGDVVSIRVPEIGELSNPAVVVH